mmetsp:Transcript_31500/g.78926  ORF Transcript_31500/g.78926 Transcript_31500/m.78926 type:complete len:286 (+) Transcript_31500:144-1001(+)
MAGGRSADQPGSGTPSNPAEDDSELPMGTALGLDRHRMAADVVGGKSRAQGAVPRPLHLGSRAVGTRRQLDDGAAAVSWRGRQWAQGVLAGWTPEGSARVSPRRIGSRQLEELRAKGSRQLPTGSTVSVEAAGNACGGALTLDAVHRLEATGVEVAATGSLLSSRLTAWGVACHLPVDALRAGVTARYYKAGRPAGSLALRAAWRHGRRGCMAAEAQLCEAGCSRIGLLYASSSRIHAEVGGAGTLRPQPMSEEGLEIRASVTAARLLQLQVAVRRGSLTDTLRS